MFVEYKYKQQLKIMHAIPGKIVAVLTDNGDYYEDYKWTIDDKLDVVKNLAETYLIMKDQLLKEAYDLSETEE